MSLDLNRRKYDWTISAYWVVAILTTVYVVFKALMVPFVMDEVSTFYLYVQTGAFQPYYCVLEPNNHILNSLLAHLSYLVFDDSPFALRLPNVLAFIVYAYYGFCFLKEFKSGFAKVAWIAFLFLNPALIAYFGLCRGYGISFALLLASLYYVYRSIEQPQVRFFDFGILANSLMIFANLTLLPLSVLIAGAGLFFLLRRKQKAVHYVVTVLFALMYAAAFCYLYGFANVLHEAGKMYISGGQSLQEALIIRMGEEISRAPGGPWLMYALVIVTIVMLLLNLRSAGYKGVLFPALIAGVCAALYISFNYRQLNYPMPRGSMHLFLMLGLSVVVLIDSGKGRIAQYIVAVPLVLLLYISVINFTVRYTPGWPNEGIPVEFAEIVKEDNLDNVIPATVSCDAHLRETWGFMNYRSGNSINEASSTHFPDTCADYIILSDWWDFDLPASYSMVAGYAPTDHKLMKKQTATRSFSSVEVGDVSITQPGGTPLGVIYITPGTSGSMRIGLSYELERSHPSQSFHFITLTHQSVQQELHDFQMIKEDNRLQSSSMIVHFEPQDTAISFALWNIDSRPFLIKDLKVLVEESAQLKEVSVMR